MLMKFCKVLFRISVQGQCTWVEWKLQISKFKFRRKGGFVCNLQGPRALNEFFEMLLKIHCKFSCSHLRGCGG